MIDCLHSPYTLLLVLLLSVYVKYVKYRSSAHPVFGKADAKVLFFRQSTKFLPNYFQKKVHFYIYFDPNQGKSPSEKGPFTQKRVFVQQILTKICKIRKKSLSIRLQQAFFLGFRNRNYRSVTGSESTLCSSILHELESLQVF